MMRQSKRQSGMTLIGLLTVLFLIGFFALLTLKILPIYLEHFKVVSSLESLQQTPDLADEPRRKIVDLLNRRLDINMVENVHPEDIEVHKEDGIVTVSVVYSVEKPLFGNLSVIADFDDQIKVSKH